MRSSSRVSVSECVILTERLKADEPAGLLERERGVAPTHPAGEDADPFLRANPRERFASRCPKRIATHPPDRPRVAWSPCRSIVPSLNRTRSGSLPPATARRRCALDSTGHESGSASYASGSGSRSKVT